MRSASDTTKVRTAADQADETAALDLWDEAVKTYEHGDVLRATRIFDTLRRTPFSFQDGADRMYAICLMQTGQLQQAGQVFEQLLARDTGQTLTRAHSLLWLSEIQNGLGHYQQVEEMVDEAIEILEAIGAKETALYGFAYELRGASTSDIQQFAKAVERIQRGRRLSGSASAVPDTPAQLFGNNRPAASTLIS